MDELKRRVKRLAQQVRTESGGANSHKLKVAGRANVVVSSNFGQEGSVQGVSARQTSYIRQDGSEESETTTQNL